MKRRKGKPVAQDSGAQSGALVVPLQLQMMAELVAAMQQEVNSLRDHLSLHSFTRAETAFNPSHGINLPAEIRCLEIQLIMCALRNTRGNQRNAARLLGLKPSTLSAKVKLYGISVVSLKRAHLRSAGGDDRDRRRNGADNAQTPGWETYKKAAANVNFK